jgi:hypothetical protein
MSALLWLTWRQHRWMIIGTSALALVAAFVLVSTEGGPVGSMLLAGFYGLAVQVAFGGVIGVFWGAPLIARELEERTYFVAWGQDVTPVQWVRGKVLLLGSLAVVLGGVIGFGGGFIGRQRSWAAFEGSPVVQAGYAIFGFALGLLIGLLSRHVVTAMAATLVAYVVVRAVVAGFVRDHYVPARREIARWENTPDVPSASTDLGGGFIGPDLDPVDVTEQCAKMANVGTCMRSSKAAIGTYVDYQPIGRLPLFQFMEVGLFALMAAALFAVTFRLLRRGGGWKPSRSHRRIRTEPAPDPAPAPVQSTPDTAAAHAEG